MWGCCSQECPATIIIDEPELGLHPYAIKLLASLLLSDSICPNYDKPNDPVLIAKQIGIDIIRKECPLLDGWIKRLEANKLPWA